ncbi:hypothetical protein IWQ60_002438 [Tieghemiomyces parasiticus]|uniref:Uncharacterized protein n=1 Tax=Tieghemiomyces parasiticus TaxID=78921 RepID=A0A9W8AJ24_9FUNG|nr:hypothetical protein IWQ60_002438 [Tieghemiomyces parasiticus]
MDNTTRGSFALGFVLAFTGLGLFIASRVVRLNYYENSIDYHTALIRYHALTWAGVVAFVLAGPLPTAPYDPNHGGYASYTPPPVYQPAPSYPYPQAPPYSPAAANKL